MMTRIMALHEHQVELVIDPDQDIGVDHTPEVDHGTEKVEEVGQEVDVPILGLDGPDLTLLKDPDHLDHILGRHLGAVHAHIHVHRKDMEGGAAHGLGLEHHPGW